MTETETTANARVAAALHERDAARAERDEWKRLALRDPSGISEVTWRDCYEQLSETNQVHMRESAVARRTSDMHRGLREETLAANKNLQAEIKALRCLREDLIESVRTQCLETLNELSDENSCDCPPEWPRCELCRAKLRIRALKVP